MNTVAVAGAALAALLPITNPIGGLAAFAGLTGGDKANLVKREAVLTGVYVFAILAVFTLLGSLLLNALGITLAALQIAGGLVVAHSGFNMINPTDPLSPQEQNEARSKPDVSFSPMAMPLIAGPGAIGVVIALSARYPGIADRIGITVAAAVVAVVVVVLLRYGTPLVDKLGPTGVGALLRIVGFLILAIGVELVVHGVLAVSR